MTWWYLKGMKLWNSDWLNRVLYYGAPHVVSERRTAKHRLPECMVYLTVLTPRHTGYLAMSKCKAVILRWRFCVSDFRKVRYLGQERNIYLLILEPKIYVISILGELVIFLELTTQSGEKFRHKSQKPPTYDTSPMVIVKNRSEICCIPKFWEIPITSSTSEFCGINKVFLMLNSYRTQTYFLR